VVCCHEASYRFAASRDLRGNGDDWNTAVTAVMGTKFTIIPQDWEQLLRKYRSSLIPTFDNLPRNECGPMPNVMAALPNIGVAI